MAKQKRNTATKLKDTLVLNKFILNLFGATSFEALSNNLKDSNLEGYDENNISKIYSELINRMFANELLKKEQLLEYDQNIYSHTKTISEKQHKPITWKYFQYLSILFAEIYLDKYFSNPDKLLETINAHVDSINAESSGYISPKYQLSDLNKLAFWNATGSGKTLIMHVNILQYLFYAEKHNKLKDINRVILLTPNEGLSKQHLSELTKSGFNAEVFSKQTTPLFSGHMVEIIDIHKLEETEGDKTVAVDSFEGNNLVLVDEGHRGASGDDWKDKRNRLCAEGFSFEYSATFGQAVSAAAGEKRDKLLQEYSKCTLFDYSYKYFYNDGYGKDYHILNLNDTWNNSTVDLYLVACLLNYYQQLKVYEDQSHLLREYQIEKPLFIFVGSKVNAVRTENKQSVSDVIRILQFLASFVKNRTESVDAITRLLGGLDGLIDNKNRPIFFNSFAYLTRQSDKYSDIYDDMLNRIFNSTISGAELHLDNLKGADGEIGLRIGDADYFAVINVGDDAKLVKLCEEKGFSTADKDFSDSLFHNINDKNSKINILIGSKKFTEGWNSWRVSTMGLMNVGKGEGTEIIQLFGRGVRLKGYKFSLKRSDKLDIGIKPNDIPKDIKYLETLYVFGIRADYMQQFKEYLEEEGLPGNDSKFEELSIPVLPAVELINSKNLKILKVRDGIDFKKDILLELYPLQEGMSFNISLDWYPKIQVLQRAKSQAKAPDDIRQEGKLNQNHLAFINWDEIYFEIQKYKNERNWYNLNIKKSTLIKILESDVWYTLYIPSYELAVHSFDQTKMWEDIASSLLKAYCDKLYNYEKNKYLSQFLEYQILDPMHPNFFDEYKFYIEKTQEQLIENLKKLKHQIESEEFKDKYEFSNIVAFEFSQHLYKPMLHFSSTSYSEILKVTPIQLVDSEKDFVYDLKVFYEKNVDFFKDKELYLLRNLSRRGISFFEANNFYPDFILWLIYNGKQYIGFIDPKGLRQVNGFNNPKIKFYKTLKESIEPGLNEPNVILNSFIVTPTKLAELNFWQDGKTLKEFENHNVYFQKEDCTNYISKILNKTVKAYK
jgi:hypothetical protein